MDLRDAKTSMAEHLRKVAYDDSTEWTKLGKPGNRTRSRKGRL